MVSLAFINSPVFSQQIAQFSQYMFNDFVFNPAIAGSNGFLNGTSSFRKQWIGFDNAPVTFSLSIHSPTKAGNHGIGGYIFVDKLGLLKRQGINLSYSYHVDVDESNRLFFGVSGIFTQSKIDGTDLIIIEQNDNAINTNANMVTLTPDLNFGLYFKGTNYYIGLATSQLLQSKVNISPLPEEQRLMLKLYRHYFGMAGYKYEVNEDIDIEPSILFKAAKGSPYQLDISSKFVYQKKYWAGLSYRTYDALVVLLGLEIFDKWNFGYSYDIITSGIRHYSSGSHEFVLGYKMDK